jgi:SAM-dependent methyltransferase
MKENQYRLMDELEETHWWFLTKRLYISSIFPKKRKKLEILDLGCGTGGLSVYLEKWGHVTRVEKSPIAKKYLIKKHIPFVEKDIGKIFTPKNYYDIICLFDVLYHQNVKNDNQVLINAFNMLKPNGILLIADSAIPWLYSFHDTENMARERYSLKNLTHKVESTGFTIVKKSYIYFFIFPIFMIMRLIGKFLKIESVYKINPIINSFLYCICNLEVKIFEYVNFPIGSSVIIKAVKILPP